jgi:myo-inositol-1-phosphate synthase
VETGSGQSFLLGYNLGLYDYHAGEGNPQEWLSNSYAKTEIKNGANYINATPYTFTTKLRDLNRNLITMIHTAAVGSANR